MENEIALNHGSGHSHQVSTLHHPDVPHVQYLPTQIGHGANHQELLMETSWEKVCWHIQEKGLGIPSLM